jgi:hypothetical protein
VTRHVPEIANNFPTIQIHLDASKFSIDAGQVNRQLASMKPSIVLGGGGRHGGGTIGISAIVLQPGHDRIIADALSKVLREHQV